MKYLRGLIYLILIISSISTQAQDIKKFQAQNRVNFEYEVVLPSNYSKDKAYELAMVFSEIEKKDDSYEKTVKHLKSVSNLSNTIFFIPKVPVGKPHWISHPIHHGLNDLMDEIRKNYGSRNQKFHFIGHLYGGRVAQTYSGMSNQYVASLSFTHSKHWEVTKQEYFDGIFNSGFKVYVYDVQEEDIPFNISKAKFTEANSFGDAISRIDKAVKSL